MAKDNVEKYQFEFDRLKLVTVDFDVSQEKREITRLVYFPHLEHRNFSTAKA